MNGHVKVLPSSAPEKFNTFNTFNTFAVFNRALEYPIGTHLLDATPLPTRRAGYRAGVPSGLGGQGVRARRPTGTGLNGRGASGDRLDAHGATRQRSLRHNKSDAPRLQWIVVVEDVGHLKPVDLADDAISPHRQR